MGPFLITDPSFKLAGEQQKTPKYHFCPQGNSSALERALVQIPPGSQNDLWIILVFWHQRMWTNTKYSTNMVFNRTEVVGIFWHSINVETHPHVEMCWNEAVLILSVQRNSGQIPCMFSHYERLLSLTSFCHMLPACSQIGNGSAWLIGNIPHKPSLWGSPKTLLAADQPGLHQ